MAPKVKRKTRKSSGDLGLPSDLPDGGALPTNKEIIASVEAELDKRDASGHPKHRIKFEREAYRTVTNSLIRKHQHVNPKLPLVPEHIIVTKILRLHRQSKMFKSNKLHPREAKPFNDKFLRLFDIIACKCEIINCGLHWLPCPLPMPS